MDKRRDTLIVLSPAFTDSESDSWLPGQEGFVRALNRMYPDLNIIILNFHFPVVASRQYSWYGNTVIAFNGAMKGQWHSIRLWTRVWRRLQQLRRQHHVIGLLSFFCSECAFIGHYFARYYSLPHQIWVMGQDAKEDNKQVHRIRPAADELVAISDTIADAFYRNHGINPAAVVPLGIDPANFSIALPAERDITLMGAGSLIPLKQYDIFIRVVQQLAAQLSNISAVICGEGPEAASLSVLIDQLGLQQEVSLSGKQPHAATTAMMQRCRIFLHTSAYEGFSSACLEALYAGAHVVSFCKPMNADLPHWHIAETETDMVRIVHQLLQEDALDHSSVDPYTMNNSAVSIMNLLGYEPSIPGQ